MHWAVWGTKTGGQVLLALLIGKLLRQLHVKFVTMTTEVITRVNYLGRDETSLLTLQNRSGKEIGKGNMLNHGHNDSKTGENPGIVDDVTRVIQPYKEYVDKWNVGIPEELVKAEVQDGDGHINQDAMGTTKNTFSGVEDTRLCICYIICVHTFAWYPLDFTIFSCNSICHKEIANVQMTCSLTTGFLAILF